MKRKVLSQQQQKLAAMFADRILSAQRKAADWLNAKTIGFSPKCWRLFLAVFILAFGTYCLSLIVQAF